MEKWQSLNLGRHGDPYMRCVILVSLSVNPAGAAELAATRKEAKYETVVQTLFFSTSCV